MAIDPTDPETFTDEEDSAEIGVEAPENDAAEQKADIAPESDDSLEGVDPSRANEADLAEQARVVTLDEDDYR
ncbi:hypothetical protein BM536_029810 [Streptomyces phaeoluteigriseus]|uniref:DUF5709 domain-containing protein n=1 Tax=Streptomyces phaeoluteigriseus TaxID=114686 RepID=A0A1V6MJB7_9ACTN|nr:hypothetical protein [Streptomyces phaeoluteigriseus]OQD52403.1 hypothetical protein BM536_029810 [Streptomyces phaeoluteigriseus]